jgi:fibronectin-binding autotransporter adhesin
MKINKSLLSAAVLASFLPLAAHAASDAWTGAVDNIFSNNSNWGTAAPGVATNVSNLDVATFGAESGGSPDYLVDFTANRSLGTLTFGTGALGYSLSGSAIRLNGSGGSGGSVITIPAALTTQSTIGISNNLSLYSSSNATTNSAWTISNNTNNVTGFSTLNLSGNITVDPLVTTGTTGLRTLTLSGGSTAVAAGLASASVINVTGVISDGTSNANVLKVTTGAGITKISGSNTYSGLTTVGAGLLLVGNNSALGTGNISFGTSGAWMGVDGLTARTLANNWSGVADNFVGFGASSAVNSSASYGINNTNAGKLTLSGNGSIGRATSGAKTFSYYQDLEFSGVISLDPTTGANITTVTLNGNLNNQTAVVTLSGANTFDKSVTLNNAIVSINTIGNVAAGIGTSLGLAGNATTGAIIFGGANSGTTLRYTGGNTTTDRAVTLNTTSQAIIEASGTGTITFTNDLTYTGTANHTGTLTLAGSNAGNNTFSGLIANNGTGAVGLTKGRNSANNIPGGGLWVVGNSAICLST